MKMKGILTQNLNIQLLNKLRSGGTAMYPRYCQDGNNWGSIGFNFSDAIIRYWFWSTSAVSCPLGYSTKAFGQHRAGNGLNSLSWELQKWLASNWLLEMGRKVCPTTTESTVDNCLKKQWYSATTTESIVDNW